MIVAIGRELGAGGRDVGERVAAALHAELLDNQIVDLVAAKIGAPASFVRARDENVEGFVDRLFRVITAAYPEAYGPDGLPDWSEERLVQLTASIIEEHAHREPLVVIGRGAPVLLKERRDVFRVFVAASVEGRVARICRRTGATHDEALRDIKKSDQHRAAYMQTYYHADWRDPGNYDLVVNTDRLGVELAAEMISNAARTPVA
ncbi:MAG TPA: cytidylate kinase-like family protein [Candidatus Eremiobacteraceae bacterium]|nr:cytidylate kinase-like family protein [Candidatus Eremiobacteraceae bacterium]